MAGSQTLARAMRAGSNDGAALPAYVFKTWEIQRAKFRSGQVVLFAAAPGGGKSALVSYIAYKLGLPTLYFSADTDKMTLGTRVAASITGYPTHLIEDEIVGGNGELWLNKVDEATQHIWFTWDASPTTDDLDDEIQAYAVVNGRYPAVIVIDNLKDVNATFASGGEDWSRYDQSIQYLREVAQQTGACVVVLHHVTKKHDDGNVPIPLSGILGACGKTPRLIFTLYNKRPGVMGVCIVKNTAGPADAEGNLQMELFFTKETMAFGERL